MAAYNLSQSAINFLSSYSPANEHFTTENEIKSILTALKTDIMAGLRPTRNSVVDFYSDKMDKEIKYDENGEYAGRTNDYWKYNNAMMSVCAALDYQMGLNARLK